MAPRFLMEFELPIESDLLYSSQNGHAYRMNLRFIRVRLEELLWRAEHHREAKVLLEELKAYIDEEMLGLLE